VCVVWVLMCFLCSSDFENKFVCGEIMSFDDLKELGSEAAVKAVSAPVHCLNVITVTHKCLMQGGKVRQQGKTYEMVDGDIAYWKAGG